MPVASMETVLSWPVANPFWMIEVTPKPPPYCVDLAEIEAHVHDEAAPSVGV